MTPTTADKVKEIAVKSLSYFLRHDYFDHDEAFDNWAASEEGSRLVGELVEGKKYNECYIPIEVTKFGDLPPAMTAVVVFFRNRKEPFVCYRETDNVWFFDNGESCKTPTHWLKKIKK